VIHVQQTGNTNRQSNYICITFWLVTFSGCCKNKVWF